MSARSAEVVFVELRCWDKAESWVDNTYGVLDFCGCSFSLLSLFQRRDLYAGQLE